MGGQVRKRTLKKDVYGHYCMFEDLTEWMRGDFDKRHYFPWHVFLHASHCHYITMHFDDSKCDLTDYLWNKWSEKKLYKKKWDVLFKVFVCFQQSQTIQMMYQVIATELKSMQLLDSHPQDYLNFYCLGNREEIPGSITQSSGNGDKVIGNFLNS